MYLLPWHPGLPNLSSYKVKLHYPKEKLYRFVLISTSYSLFMFSQPHLVMSKLKTNNVIQKIVSTENGKNYYSTYTKRIRN